MRSPRNMPSNSLSDQCNAPVLIWFVCVCVFQNAGAGGTEGVRVVLAGVFDPSVSLGSPV